MSITVNKNTIDTNDKSDTISMGSNESIDLSFEEDQQDQEKTNKAKECFKTIYGTGE